MSPWLKLAYAAAGLALDEWRAARAERKRQQQHAQDPRSTVWVQCNQCGRGVRADQASLNEHICPKAP
jgi:acetyl-CoA carboxylase beta subunit